jgi:ABC-2 type transport system permease protein
VSKTGDRALGSMELGEREQAEPGRLHGRLPPSQSAGMSPLQPSAWLAAAALCQREWVRFVRQPNRVFGAIGQPLVFWILFGAGLGPSFRLPGGDHATISYREYFFPGTLVLILLFTAIFATISIIEDRREGFLQSVLVAPLPRWSMVLGKILGGTLIAVTQACVFLVLGLTLGLPLTPLTLAAVVAWMFLVGLALTALGFVIAWRLDSTQGFHAVMSVLLLPMWLLSGAFFPADTGWLAWIIRLNPLTYGVAGLRRLLYLEAPEAVRAAALPAGLPSAWACGLLTVLFAVGMFVLAWRAAGRRISADLL